MNTTILNDWSPDFQLFFSHNWGMISKLKEELGRARREASWVRSNWQDETHLLNGQVARLQAENRRLREQVKALARINQLSLEARR